MESTTYGENGNGNGLDRDKAMETIMKCLTLAADPGATEDERNVAARKAEQIMARWQISTMEMRVKSEQGKPRTTANVKDRTEQAFDPAADWEFHLAMGVSKTFNSKVIVSHDRTDMRFFGSANDLEIIDYFFSKLRMEIDSWAEDAYPRGIRDRRSYAYGMVCRVNQRMDELYKVVEKMMPNDCKDLILVDKALVSQRIKELYPTLGKMKSRAVRNDAYARGFSDGNSLNLESNRSRLHG